MKININSREFLKITKPILNDIYLYEAISDIINEIDLIENLIFHFENEGIKTPLNNYDKYHINTLFYDFCETRDNFLKNKNIFSDSTIELTQAEFSVLNNSIEIIKYINFIMNFFEFDIKNMDIEYDSHKIKLKFDDFITKIYHLKSSKYKEQSKNIELKHNELHLDNKVVLDIIKKHFKTDDINSIFKK